MGATVVVRIFIAGLAAIATNQKDQVLVMVPDAAHHEAMLAWDENLVGHQEVQGLADATGASMPSGVRAVTLESLDMTLNGVAQGQFRVESGGLPDLSAPRAGCVIPASASEARSMDWVARLSEADATSVKAAAKYGSGVNDLKARWMIKGLEGSIRSYSLSDFEGEIYCMGFHVKGQAEKIAPRHPVSDAVVVELTMNGADTLQIGDSRKWIKLVPKQSVSHIDLAILNLSLSASSGDLKDWLGQPLDHYGYYFKLSQTTVDNNARFPHVDFGFSVSGIDPGPADYPPVLNIEVAKHVSPHRPFCLLTQTGLP